MQYYSEQPSKRSSKEENNLFRDTNQAIFSFNFGLSLLDQFVKLEFGASFGVSIIDSFIK